MRTLNRVLLGVVAAACCLTTAVIAATPTAVDLHPLPDQRHVHPHPGPGPHAPRPLQSP